MIDMAQLRGGRSRTRRPTNGRSLHRPTAALLAVAVLLLVLAVVPTARSSSAAPRPRAITLGSGTTLQPTPFGFTPTQIRDHYGFNAMGNDANSMPIDGRGQIIGIVLWGGEPDLGEELAGFIKAYGLEEMNGLTDKTACTVSRTIHAVPCLQVVGAGGSVPPVDRQALTEAAADAEWAHVTAPGADILFVEAHEGANNVPTAALDDQAITTAVTDGATVVSMSWSDRALTASDNSVFEGTSTSFVSGLGDFGCPDTIPYPAASSYVLSVGGTDLNTAMTSEPAWSKTGGYVNASEPRPGYQLHWTTAAGRSDNDVSYDAVSYSVYKVSGKAKGWASFQGVSIGIPQWAGLIADADQNRVSRGKSVLASSGLMDALYLAANSNEPKPGKINPAMFTDVTSGSGGTSAGCKAKVGWDEGTGLGTPKADGLVNELANL